VLAQRRPGAEPGAAAWRALVWVGAECAAGEAPGFAEAAAGALFEAHGWARHGAAALVREGEEDEDFFDLFELG
jgi:hypothetical protein